MNKKVALIIINWNGKKFLKDCFTAVNNQTHDNFDVYFVDNGSTDGSVEYIRENFPKTKITELTYNSGFAKANNIGIIEAFKDSKVEYIACLNNDTKIDQKFLENLVNTIGKNDKIGSVAPKIKFFFEENLIDSIGLLIHQDGSVKRNR
jgi:hypothetical protein